MESLIANLADNALRYNVPGGWAELATATRDSRAVVSVRNTGPVIPARAVERLFRPFQRLGTERTQRSGGHGLGLAIVRAIADAHGATVTTAARVSGGLDITVTFPAAEAASAARRVRDSSLAAAGGTSRLRIRRGQRPPLRRRSPD